MVRFLLQIIANAIGIWLATLIIPAIQFSGNILQLLVAGLVLGIINVLLKPILKIISSPLIILTLGLFTIIINMFLLWLTVKLVPDLFIANLAGYFWGSIVISLVNFVFHLYRKRE
ncbi:phage holin family protein [Patescibacteria group bacterium]|jgi:putative membrane protein|nr:phage holin family protein [Patescibacteria group bacterium]